MIPLSLLPEGKKALKVLCVGAHCDDIEIGCGASLLRLAAERALEVTWLVLCSTPERALETRVSAARFLKGARAQNVKIEGLRDSFLPAQWSQAKLCFESLKSSLQPDLVFTHEGDDRHQDHRTVCELTWNTFRDHLILEYEIPKYDGGLGRPNVYVPVSAALAERKAKLLLASYRSQSERPWFTRDTFFALMRLRGLECNAKSGLAEAFHLRKGVI